MFNSNWYALLTLLLCHLGSAVKSPDIKALAWVELDNQAWSDDVVNADQEGPVTLVNRTPYPVEWDYSHAKWIGTHKKTLGSLFMSTRRISTDMNNPKTFQYWSQIGFYGDSNLFNGNYVCKQLTDSSVQSNITVFWEGGPIDNEFVLSGANLTIYVEKSDKIIFPCYVRDPNTEVVLLQDIVLEGVNDTGNDTWVPVPLSSTLSFKPEVGFVFQKKPTEEWLESGIYKCSTKDGSDSLLLNFVAKYEDQSPLITNAPITAPASLKRLDNRSSWFATFECCSNSQKPPRMYILSCYNPSMCKMLQLALRTEIRRDVSPYIGRTRTNGSCTVFDSWGSGQTASSLVKCVGDGIKVAREFFFEDSLNISYYDWDLKTLQKWVQIDPWAIKISSNNTDVYQVYSGESRVLNCRAPAYFFSYGIRWTLKFKDGTIETLPDTVDLEKQTPIFVLLPRKSIDRPVTINVTKDLDSLTCHVPVWNSSDWVTKSVQFFVKEPIPSTIENADNENVFWILNETDKTLTCNVFGDPQPNVIWMKYNKVGSSQLYNISRHHGYSILKIPQVTHDAEGEYKCTGINFAGTSSKTFTVFVKESHVAAMTTTIIVTIVILLLLIGGILIIKKTILQKKTLDDLRESVHSPDPSTAS